MLVVYLEFLFICVLKCFVEWKKKKISKKILYLFKVFKMYKLVNLFFVDIE